HTVYLATLRFLLNREPWREGVRLRECHAGRGVYQIPSGDARQRLVSCLFTRTATASAAILHNAQSEAATTLRCWPDSDAGSKWYAGSAVMNSLAVDNTRSSRHSVDLYEWQPETRHILRAI